ncbi:MAG: zinc-binding alcohol dehydrogenase [Micropruina sp.]|uniref:zinc-dependent alcohol dehydrogenase n=1 Tax=Micropruina sp. TaxID=2737536 RepID=UPI0039E4913D
MEATAYWTVAPGEGELRRESIAEPGPDQVRVRTLASGLSRGTELLVHRHAVPESVRTLMRCPFQSGDLPGPVKYGYLSVGVVEAGAAHLLGKRVFCLHPHQDFYVVPAAAVTEVPDGVPAERAVLAGTVETAVNALWDGGPRIGDRVAVIGAGMVGLSVAALLRRFPLGRLELIDIDPGKADVAAAIGVPLVAPESAAGDCDLIFEASANADGVATALRLCGDEGEVIELSWFGETRPSLPLGAEFHARRLTLRASQVGRVSPARASRRTTADRLRLALELLRDNAFDALLARAVPFADLPETLRQMDAGRGTTLCQVIGYPQEDACTN